MARTVTTNKTQWSQDEVAQLWIEEGGDPRYAQAAAFIATTPGVESSGRSDIVNSIGATGLFQIYPGNATLKDARRNVRAAIAKFNAARKRGTGFEPWASSESKWGPYIDKQTGAVKGGKGNGGFNPINSAKDAIGDLIPDVPNPLKGLEALVAPIGDIANFFSGAFELLLTPEGWRRILKVSIGSMILLWGINQLSKSVFGGSPARAVKKGAMVAATKGAGAKAATAAAA